MDEIKVRKEGLLIPSDWLKGFGPRVLIARGRDVLIIEAPRRAAARRRLKEQVHQLRGAARLIGAPSSREVVAEVTAVRTRRARRR
ncbi:MAG: hypothetical protein A3I01_15085 [Betaproteobacteria bacterium RIFCSPLOWO2_02_FULL_65_24]|nr:MAG: hypothetical protein A3I01_15085 [Betaproteobacteria bacterium RIFCSPLOWO2_02_FULL_65_24]OGA37099.1 MAG: hypothetical protein A3G80_07780 [Betaproteobacteria bacterium RIFCSPLOWO2_12_FULL_62_13b]